MFQLYDATGPIEAVTTDTAVTVGVFDGVHCGHRDLLRQLSAFPPTLAPLVVTLTAHPSFVLGRRSSEYWLDDPEEHLRLLFEAGAKYVAVLPFTADVATLTACRMARLMHKQMRMQALLLGYDSRFGSKTNDDFGSLPQLAATLGIALRQGTPFLLEGQPVSSSRIRQTLLDGDVHATAALLGRPYSITGTVLHGRGVGHTLGFPTANIDLAETRKMLPREGVYAIRCESHLGMANLGSAPTFGVEKPLLEVHLLDFHGDIYNRRITVHFIQRLRDIVRFDSPEALQRQLADDLAQCRRYE